MLYNQLDICFDSCTLYIPDNLGIGTAFKAFLFFLTILSAPPCDIYKLFVLSVVSKSKNPENFFNACRQNVGYKLEDAHRRNELYLIWVENEWCSLINYERKPLDFVKLFCKPDIVKILGRGFVFFLYLTVKCGDQSHTLSMSLHL